jgi:hypothetical protein
MGLITFTSKAPILDCASEDRVRVFATRTILTKYRTEYRDVYTQLYNELLQYEIQHDRAEDH